MHMINSFTAIYLFILSVTFIFVSRITFLVLRLKTNKKHLKSFLVICSIIVCLKWICSIFIWNYLCFVFTFESHYHLVCNSSLAVLFFFPSTWNILYNYLLLLFVFVVRKPAVLLLLPGWSNIFPLHFVFRHFTMMYLIRVSLHLFH